MDTETDMGVSDADDTAAEDTGAEDVEDTGASDTEDTSASDAEDGGEDTESSDTSDTSDATTDDAEDTYHGQNSACDRELLNAGGDIALVDPPASVITGENEDNSRALLFTERVEYSLPSALDVDTVAPGTYEAPGDLSPTTIASGTTICSYYLHYDPVGQNLASATGSVTFPGEIVGVIALNDTLLNSHSVLQTDALPTTYPSPSGTQTEFDGMELDPAKDYFTIGENGTTLDITFEALEASDAARVLVEVSP
ncbi:MAG: hypothetical protein ACQEVA_19855 [Myxococcota bacterium]